LNYKFPRSVAVLYSPYMNVAPETSGTFLALSADDASPYSTDRKHGFLRKQVRRPHVRGVIILVWAL